MSNPAVPSNPNAPKGGMPKWLIILLVVLLVLIIGCCGGVATCLYIARRAANNAVVAFEEAARQAQIDAQRAAASAGSTTAPVDPATGLPADTPAVLGRLPQNFPGDIPTPAGYTPSVSSADMVNDGGVVQFLGTGKHEEVVTFYVREMQAKGWQVTVNTRFGDTTSLVFTKGERNANIAVTPDGENRTVVTLTYGKQ